jgi:hypothetical protein
MSGMFVVSSMLTIATVLMMGRTSHLSLVMFSVDGMLGIHFHGLSLLIVHKIDSPGETLRDRTMLAELPLSLKPHGALLHLLSIEMWLYRILYANVHGKHLGAV